MTLTEVAFRKAWCKWKTEFRLTDPSVYSIYSVSDSLPIWNTLTQKLLRARNACRVPIEDTIYMVAVKGFMGSFSSTLLVCTSGVYSSETLQKFFYSAEKNPALGNEEENSEGADRNCSSPVNFVPWIDLLNKEKLLARENEKIYLNGKYVLNAMLNSKRIFRFLLVVRKLFSDRPPFCFSRSFLEGTYATQSMTLPKAEFGIVQKALQMSVSSKNLLQTTVLNPSQSKELVLRDKAQKPVVLVTPEGLQVWTKTEDWCFLSWKQISSNSYLLVSRKKICFEKQQLPYSPDLFAIILFLHSYLLHKRITGPLPPAYEEVRELLTKLGEI